MMANMSHRNLAWLNAQQDKLTRLKSVSKPSTKTPQVTANATQTTLAFSNPIYDEIRSTTPESANSSSPDPDRATPVPKPRKSRVPVKTPEPPSPDIYENVPESLESSDAVETSNSFLFFEKELPAKMTQLLNEIETLAESLASSDPENSTEVSPTSTLKPQPHRLNSPERAQPQGTFRRKRIEVKKELFKFSFSSGSDIISPVPTPDLSNPLDHIESTLKNTDSGVFSLEHHSSGDSTQNASLADAMVSESGDSAVATTVEEDPYSLDQPGKPAHLIEERKSIPPSPPPRLPPRKPVKFQVNSVQSQAESVASIPTYPPPPIPQPQPQPQSQPAAPNEPPPSQQQSQLPPLPAPLQPIYLNSEVLSMEHLHLNKLSLQRSGYLWKTGPNYKSFKYRWCILYRHNIDLADANFSYYFNRSSISASLSGKIMISEIEFICICETVPGKTRLPKLEKSEEAAGGKGAAGNGVCFLEIGVRSRQGRVYLFAARANIDRQLWMHAFVQALSLHAFKNKELYHFGFIRAKFTVTACWQNCFALLTTDRFLYIFEMQPNMSEAASMMKAINCKNYHVFNLRQTVRISRLDDPTGVTAVPVTTNLDCKNGFSLTQNGGRVVYMVCDFEGHINRWFRSVMKFWPTPEEQEKMVFEEQYLTKDNIPVAIDKCLKFLDTFTVNQKTPLFTNIEQQHPIVLANSTKLLANFRLNAWNVHLLPQQHSSPQVSLLLLLYLRSMNQCIFTEVMLGQWMRAAEMIEEEHEGCIPKEVLEKVKKLLKLLPPINYATLRRVIICLANAHIQYPLSTSLCKALVFSKQKTTPISLLNARCLLTTLIKNHLFLFEVTKEEVDKEMHIKRVVHLIINQRLEDRQNIGQMTQSLPSQVPSDTICPTTISKPTPMSSAGGPPNTVIDTRQVNSLIIGIKVCYGGGVNACDKEKVVVNVHLNKETTAENVLDMVLEKSELKEHDKSEYSLFEIICYRRLERVILKNETLLPIVIGWSIWPSHWSAEASFEVRHSDSLMKGSLALLHNKDKYQNQVLSSTSPSSSAKAKGHGLRRTSQSMKVRPTNPNANSNYPQMLMSVIRYCGQNDTRMAKKILAEFSSSSLFLYCKESHQLIGQHGVEDFFWYIGIESGALVHSKPAKTTCAEEDMATSQMANYSPGNEKQRMLPHRPTAPALTGSSDLNVPALTVVDKRLLNVCQSKDRLNFGQTLVFNSWNELYQWIRALMTANDKVNNSDK